MFTAPHPIPEIHGVTPDSFRTDILPAAQPVVMRGLVADWPAVAAARQSDDAIIAYLKHTHSGPSVEVLRGPGDIGGHFFYNRDMTGLNFTRHMAGFGDTLDEMLAQSVPDGGEAINIQSTPLSALLGPAAQANRMTLVPDTVAPRIWLGNAVRVQTHFDLSQNIACVVAGRREFTLFPPDQTTNLYMGPIERTLAGTPVSLVDIDAVDTARFPRFELAVADAMSAELGPGDAIFIPYFWWHHVRSLGRLNVLVNYWWNGFDRLGSPMDALLHAILVLRDLPPAMKAPWRQIFADFVFGDDLSAADHIPAHVRGGLGQLDDASRAQLWQALAQGVGQFAQHVGQRRP